MLLCKVIDERDLLLSKAPSLIEVTFTGTVYDVKLLPLKASAPIVCIWLGNDILLSLLLANIPLGTTPASRVPGYSKAGALAIVRAPKFAVVISLFENTLL